MTIMEIIKNLNELEQVFNSHDFVIVDFYADWCMPCKMVLKHIESTQDLLPHVKIVKVNVDESNDLTAHYGVRSIPTIMFVKSGQIEKTVIKALNQKEMIDLANLIFQ